MFKVAIVPHNYSVQEGKVSVRKAWSQEFCPIDTTIMCTHSASGHHPNSSTSQARPLHEVMTQFMAKMAVISVEKETKRRRGDEEMTKEKRLSAHFCLSITLLLASYFHQNPDSPLPANQDRIFVNICGTDLHHSVMVEIEDKSNAKNKVKTTTYTRFTQSYIESTYPSSSRSSKRPASANQ